MANLDEHENSISQLLYFSRAVGTPSTEELDDLLIQARDRNARENITGLLLLGGGHYYQILEGPKSNVLTLFADIQADTRHTEVTQISIRKCEGRSFLSWWMGFRRTEPGPLPDNSVYHDSRNRKNLRKLPTRSDPLFRVMISMYETNP